jgi:hypothetical protein
VKMRPKIESLVDDIYEVVKGAKAPATSNNNVNVSYDKWFTPRDKQREEKVLYFSEVGDPCLRRQWFKYNQPEQAEQLDGNTLLKFFYGDILEELVLQVAEDAGHEVSHKQEKVFYEAGDGWWVRGRIDAIIDGVVVDVKSVTKYSEEKFKKGLVEDPFGYYQQLNGYASALANDSAWFVTIQKELGHVAYYPIETHRGLFNAQVKHSIEGVSEKSFETLPGFAPVPQSATSSNTKLCASCSYCSYKKQCFPQMRTFLYSSGPVHLVDVVDTPRVPEVTNEDTSNT